MRKLTILLLIFAFTFACVAQEDRTRLTPTPDPNAPFRVYIPKDLEDCFDELRKMLPPAVINEIRHKPEEGVIEYHHSLGRWIRNNWGLWASSRLAQYFNQLGIRHPDDMSGIILTSFWRHLNSQSIRLEEQIEHYQEYWRRAAERESAVTLVPTSAMRSALTTANGETIRLSDFEGKVVVLAWLDTSCGLIDRGCRMASTLVRLKHDFGLRGVEVIGHVGTNPANSARGSRQLRRFISRYRINFPLVWSDDRFSYDVSSYEEFGYMSFPQIFIISRDGHVVKRIRGFNPQTDPAQLREAVEQAIRRN